MHHPCKMFMSEKAKENHGQGCGFSFEGRIITAGNMLFRAIRDAVADHRIMRIVDVDAACFAVERLVV